MTILLAVLISGVLLNSNDKPLPKSYLALTATDGKLIQVRTDENGKFQVDLAPGTYRYQWGLFTVDKNTSTLKLKLDRPLPARRVPPPVVAPVRRVPPPVVEAPEPPRPEIPDYSLRLGPRA